MPDWRRFLQNRAVPFGIVCMLMAVAAVIAIKVEPRLRKVLPTEVPAALGQGIGDWLLTAFLELVVFIAVLLFMGKLGVVERVRHLGESVAVRRCRRDLALIERMSSEQRQTKAVRKLKHQIQVELDVAIDQQNAGLSRFHRRRFRSRLHRRFG